MDWNAIGLGEIFSVACAVCWALAVILFRKSGETLPAFELNLFKNLLGFGLMIPTALLMDGAMVPAYSLQEWLIVLTSGYIGIAVADTWYLRALNLMGAGRTGITASLFSPFVITLSFVFLGERLGWWQLAGFALVMVGILLVTWRQHLADVSPAAVKKGVAYGASAVFLMAAGVVMVKGVLERHPFYWTVEWRLVGGVVGMLIFAGLSGSWCSIADNFRKPQPWGTIILASVLAAYVSMLFWLAGYKLTSASIASMLNETASAFIVLFAWLILKEPITQRKVLGLMCTLTGVLLVISKAAGDPPTPVG